MNTLIYSSFADELEQIKLAQLEKDAFGAALGAAAKQTGQRLMGMFGRRSAMGARAAAPAAKAAPATSGPTMAIGSAPTMAATPATVPYGAAGLTRPPGVATGWGTPMRAQLPAGVATGHEQAVQQVLARSRARLGPAGAAAPRGPLPVGKQQLDVSQLSPLQQTRLRLFQQQARQRMGFQAAA